MFYPSLRFGNIACRLIACLVAVHLLTSPGRAESQIAATSHARMGDGPLHAYVGTVSLPAGGIWNIHAANSEHSIRELYLVPTQPSQRRQLGNRMYAALEERLIQNSRWQVQMGYEACRQYAQQGKGFGPKSIADLADDKQWKYVSDRWNTGHWRTNDLVDFIGDEPPEGPFVHLIPEVRFQFSEPKTRPGDAEASIPVETPPRAVVRKVVPRKNRFVLAFELRPLVDDGKHWVLYTDGNCERMAIDPELIKTQHVKIRPIVNQDRPKGGADRPNLEYRLVLVAGEPVTDSLRLDARNHVLDRTLELEWDIATSPEESYSNLRNSITAARQFAWRPYLMAANGGVLKVWDQSDPSIQPPANPQRNLSMFSVLGGRAAIDETLQLQDLRRFWIFRPQPVIRRTSRYAGVCCLPVPIVASFSSPSICSSNRVRAVSVRAQNFAIC